jgi:hypothetical protein
VRAAGVEGLQQADTMGALIGRDGLGPAATHDREARGQECRRNPALP